MRVLVIEDSHVVRRYVCLMLEQHADIEVLEASDGLAGLSMARHERPDVILTDLMLPSMHGIDIIKAVMREQPCPIVVLSGHLRDADKDLAFEAIDAGAVDVMAKPEGLDEFAQEQFQRRLLKTVRLMAEVPVVARRRDASAPALALAPTHELDALRGPIEIVAIGASTGGPPLVVQLLAAWPTPPSVPVIVVQHIVPGFEHSFAQWLANSTGHDVRVARTDDRVLAGRVYVAPGNAHLEVEPHGSLRLTHIEPDNPATTSIDLLFASIAKHYGASAWGILLTGMGSDGANGLLRMKERGAFTIVQDAASSTIDGMPGTARKLGAASMIMSPPEICALIQARFGQREMTTESS